MLPLHAAGQRAFMAPYFSLDEIPQNDPHTAYALALANFRNGKNEEAARICRDLLAKDPDNEDFLDLKKQIGGASQ